MFSCVLTWGTLFLSRVHSLALVRSKIFKISVVTDEVNLVCDYNSYPQFY